MSGRRPSVLLIGTDRYVLRACERHDLDTVVLCGPSSRDEGLVRIPPSVTALFVEDYRSAEASLAALHRAGLAGHRFDAVHTTNEWAVVTAGVLGRLLGCRAIDPATAVHFRDKHLQKERVRAAGVPVARTTLVEDIYDVTGVPFEFDRAVLKPVAGASTKLTTVVRDRAGLREHSDRYRAAGVSQRTFLLEEFVAGDEWIADGVVFGGEVLFYALARYADPCLTVINEQVPLWMHRFDPVADEWAYTRADPVVRAGIAALGLTDGVFHLELFHDPESDRVVFSECGARRGGALTQEEVHSKFHVDLGEAELMCALGHRPDLNVKVRPEVVGSAFLPGRPGTLISYPSPAELLAQPNVEFVRVELPFGTTVPAALTDSSQRVGQLLLAAESVERMRVRITELRTWFDHLLVTAQPGLTPRERWAWQRENWPDADFRDAVYRGA